MIVILGGGRGGERTFSGGPEGWGPEAPKSGAWRVGPRRVGGIKFRAFFSSPTTIFFHSSLSWGSSRGILVVFEAPGP